MRRELEIINIIIIMVLLFFTCFIKLNGICKRYWFVFHCVLKFVCVCSEKGDTDDNIVTNV